MATSTSATTGADRASTGPRPGPLNRLWSSPPMLRHLLIGLIALVVAVAVIAAAGSFVQNQLATLAYFAIAAVGLTVLTGLSGQISLGHGAFMAVGAYTASLLMPSRDQQAPLIVILLASTAVALVVGLVVGAAAARLHGPYLAGATLALAVAVPGLALYFDEWLGGEQGRTVSARRPPGWLDDGLYFLTGRALSNSSFLAYLGWFLLIALIVLLANLACSRTGRQWRAVRDDEVAASLAGIDLGRSRVLAFVVSAATAGLAGALMAMVTRIVAPAGFTLTLSLGLLAAIVLGGLGSLSGAVIGSVLIVLLPQVATRVGSGLGLSDVKAAELSPLAYGLTTMLVILLAPQGLVGTLRTAWLRRRTPAAAARESGGSGPGGLDARPGPVASDDPQTGSTQSADPNKETNR